jgi:hypothetical protein
MLKRCLLLITLYNITACGDGNFNFNESEINTNNGASPSRPIVGNNDNDSDSSNPICLNVRGLDGANGFLWKPVSESDGNLVVILPTEFKERAEQVRVVSLSGQIESGTFRGFANGNRQHWRFSSAGSSYTGTVTIISKNGECVYQVPNPSIRQD